MDNFFNHRSKTMTTQTSKLTSLCKLALAASMLLGAAQWANAADAPVADTKPSVQKGIKDNAVKSCGNCGLTGKVAAPTAGAAEGKTTPSTESKKCPTGYTWSGGDVCTNAKGIRTSTI
jgi:hypothetical protein